MLTKKLLKKINETKPVEDSFGEHFGFYQLFWIFMIGCFLGVVIENIYCFATMGHFESRVGLVYGPFNLVYGFGTLCLTLGLHWIKDKSVFFIFLGGAVIGSLVEYLSSWVQEMVIGTISWDYSSEIFNVQGRTSLLFSIYWGILAILWIKLLYPLFVKVIKKIPQTYGYVLTWILLIFMIYNTTISSLAVYRWQERLTTDTQTTTILDEYLDSSFPDSKMEALFPNMETKKH